MSSNNKIAYSIGELPSLTGFGRSKIYEEISAGRLVARKVGTRTIVLASDLAVYLQSLPCIVKPYQHGAKP
jgi:hypothetical protein